MGGIPTVRIGRNQEEREEKKRASAAQTPGRKARRTQSSRRDQAKERLATPKESQIHMHLTMSMSGSTPSKWRCLDLNTWLACNAILYVAEIRAGHVPQTRWGDDLVFVPYHTIPYHAVQCNAVRAAYRQCETGRVRYRRRRMRQMSDMANVTLDAVTTRRGAQPAPPPKIPSRR